MKHLAMLVVAAVLALAAPAGGVARAEPVVLTVTGAIERPYRGPRDDFADALFKAHDIAFDKARAFTRVDLAALGQKVVTITYDKWPRAVRARGPRLADVLAAAGGPASGTVSVQALDGYAYTFPIDLVERSADMILAIEVDGQPLSIGGRGPAWLVFPPGLLSNQQEDEGLVWAAFHVRVDAAK